jgi:hypothetical protein
MLAKSFEVIFLYANYALISGAGAETVNPTKIFVGRNGETVSTKGVATIIIVAERHSLYVLICISMLYNNKNVF